MRCPACGQPLPVDPPSIDARSTRIESRRVPSNGNGKSCTRPPGERRVSLDAMLNASTVLASLHCVEGRWMKLGDMRKGDCLAASANYERLARGAKAKANAFERIAALLGGKTVAQALGENGVLRLFGGEATARELLIPKVNHGDR